MINNEEKFWSLVDKSGDCWTWTRKPNKTHGYCEFRMNGHKQLCHRLSWVFTYGSIVGDLFVLHKCDNKICVRPDHLFLGTQADNMQDKSRKGRAKGKILYGELNGFSKLSKQQVVQIRRDRENGDTLTVLAKRYRVCIATIHRVVNRVCWGHV